MEQYDKIFNLVNQDNCDDQTLRGIARFHCNFSFTGIYNPAHNLTRSMDALLLIKTPNANDTDNLYKTMQRLVFWKNMYKEMKAYCNSCKQCQEGNPYTVKTSGKLQEWDRCRKFEVVHLDTWSGVPKALHTNNEAVLVITDRATRFCVAVPIREKTAECIAKAFVQNWIRIFAIPECILTDGGSEFKGVWNEILKLLSLFLSYL